MKNFTRIPALSIVVLVFIAFIVVPVSAYSQKKSKEETLAAFPESVSGIFKNSCVGCHSDQSNSKAKIFLNLSNWNDLNSKKQAKTAKSISKKASNASMPPAGFVERRPEAALTPAQIVSISEWSKTVKRKK